MTNKIPDEIIEAMLAEIKPDGLPADASDIRAALAAAEAMGWKLVPREPTQDMDQAGRCDSEEGVPVIWDAMWRAAPR